METDLTFTKFTSRKLLEFRENTFLHILPLMTIDDINGKT